MDEPTTKVLIDEQIAAIKEQKEAYLRNSLAELDKLKTATKADQATIEAQKRYIEHLHNRDAYDAKILEYTEVQKEQFSRIADALDRIASK